MAGEPRNTTRHTGRYLLVIGLLAAFFACFITGVFKVPAISQIFGMTYRSAPMVVLTAVHDWTGVVLGALIIVHVLVYRKWILAMSRKIILARY